MRVCLLVLMAGCAMHQKTEENRMQSLIAEVRRVAELLAVESPDGRTLSQSIGTITADHEGANLEVRPRDAQFQLARVSREHRSPVAATVELRLSQPVPLADLSALGELKAGPRLHPDSPTVLSGNKPIVTRSERLSVAVLVEVDGANRAVAITLRRDAW